jgi:putative colanic acid biosynthesis glycosyltransferase
MRVVQINSTVNTGSTGRIAEDIGQLLLDNGHESYIAYGRYNRSSNSQLLKVGTKFEVLLHGVNSAIFDRHGFGSRWGTRSFLNVLDKLRPDVILLHNLHGYYLHVGYLFEWIAKHNISTFWTLHDCWAFTGHCAHFESACCFRWKDKCHDCPKKNSYPRSFVFDQSRRNYKDKKYYFNLPSNLQIITPSLWLANHVSKSFLKNHPVHIINNGIDLGRFRVKSNSTLCERYSIVDKKIILGVSSIWNDQKGFNDFIRLRRLLPESFVIVLIGLKTSQMKSLPGGIIGIPRTECIDELASWYSLAFVFFNPTWQDNFPTTNLEALACGTPVITYATGGSPESVDDNTGKVVEKGDLSCAVKAIIEYERCDRSAIAMLCRARAEKYFNRNDRYLEYMKLLESSLY